MNVQLEQLLTIGGSALIGAFVVNTAPSKNLDSYIVLTSMGNDMHIIKAQCAGPFCMFQHFARNDLNGTHLPVNPASS